MTDYKEDQANEIEALESIYPEEFTVLTATPYHCFTIKVTAQNENNRYGEEEQEETSFTVQFTYTEKYPDEAPLIEITDDSTNLEDDEIDNLLEFIISQVEENLGMVMVFTLVAAAQEKVNEIVEGRLAKIEEEKLRKQKELEEEEKKKFHGTHVTIETFLAWKEKFDQEMAEKRKKKGVTRIESKKPTGKELFMRDHTLDDSDVKFLEEEGDSVQVDESLFQDMDDLDLDEEFED